MNKPDFLMYVKNDSLAFYVEGDKIRVGKDIGSTTMTKKQLFDFVVAVLRCESL